MMFRFAKLVVEVVIPVSVMVPGVFPVVRNRDHVVGTTVGP